ncbi:MAG: 7TM-DISM domain-containing protein, partial [Bacteroidia bacterium]|nr:7TM-DISM domain-containing protein [Bacteroidia bacterium]
MKKFFILFSFYILVSLSAAQTAVMDFSGWKPDDKNVLKIDQKWEFYWNNLLTPADFKNDSTNLIQPDTLLIPGSWGDLKIKNKSISNIGYATYRIKLNSLPDEELTLDIYSVQTSFRVFLNGKLAGEVGTIGTDKESTTPMNRDIQLRIPSGAKDVEMIVQVANFHHRKGGFVHAFEIGKSRAVIRHRMVYYFLDIAESSALAIIGLFLFCLYIFRKKDAPVLYFALFCITLSFRPVISVNYLASSVFYGINWSMMLKTEYLAVFFPCLFIVLFIKNLFPHQMPNWFVKINSAIFILKILIVLCCPPSIFSWLTLPLQVFVPLGVVMIAITILRAMLAKVEGSTYAGIGMVILLISMVLKIMTYSGILGPMDVTIT